MVIALDIAQLGSIPGTSNGPLSAPGMIPVDRIASNP